MALELFNNFADVVSFCWILSLLCFCQRSRCNRNSIRIWQEKTDGYEILHEFRWCFILLHFIFDIFLVRIRRNRNSHRNLTGESRWLWNSADVSFCCIPSLMIFFCQLSRGNRNSSRILGIPITNKQSFRLNFYN